MRRGLEPDCTLYDNKEMLGLRARSIQTLLLQSSTWRITLACSRSQYDRGDQVTPNGEMERGGEKQKKGR